MKIALLGWYPLRGNRISGGPEAVVAQLARGLSRQPGTEVHAVVCAAGIPRDLVEQRDGLTVHGLRLRPVPRWTLLRANARAVRRVVDRIAPDVVHAHGAGLFADAAIQSGRPYAITVHGVLEREAAIYRRHGMTWRDRLSWAYDLWYERFVLRRARDVVAISPYVEAVYRPITTARMHQIDNPVADAYFHLPDRSEPATVLCAARVVPRKNTLGLLQAFDQVRQAVPEARLRLAGDIRGMPDYVAQCQQFVQARGMQDAVDFLGWLDEPSVQEEYSRCTVLALASWQETAPIAIEQAMAAGKPVVASDVGGVRHLMADGLAGMLVRADDVGDIAQALITVLKDADLRQRLGQAGRVEARRRFQLDAVATKTLALYRQLIAERQAQP